MLHFLDDKNLVDGEREELNKILFQQNQEKAQCEVTKSLAIFYIRIKILTRFLVSI